MEVSFAEEGCGGFVFAFAAKDAAIEAAVKAIAPNAVCKWREKDNESWIENYQKGFIPIEIAGFFVRASWHAPREDLIDISIDPEMVFGSGHHETTALCLEAIASFDLKGKTVLDVGTGSGILAIAAAKKGASIDFCDTDEKAVEAAVKNCAINSVKPRDFWVGSADKATNNYDLAFANIVAEVLIALKGELKRAVKVGGTLVLSGVLERYAPRLREAFGDMRLKNETKKGEWLTFAYEKLSESE